MILIVTPKLIVTLIVKLQTLETPVCLFLYQYVQRLLWIGSSAIGIVFGLYQYSLPIQVTYKGRPANGEGGVVLKFRTFPDGGWFVKVRTSENF